MATIEIDGKKIEVAQGKMIIEAADDAGISIPRFCYHKKLSVAANCRMCLVQIEKVNKAMPACATPVTDGMKVFTKSPMARAAQKAVMEFLLINHPLDCPICDQGGECELQDVSLGFGGDSSSFEEQKRVVKDEDLGSLISTDMTRCIHCTRCVRFGEEIAGMRELGMTGRGESSSIGTFVEKNIASEISGNVIDLCPVGALTSKPYRFTARAWELSAHPSISPHDCMGSHLEYHVRRGEVMRAVPREMEELNETWLSDRDRFSYTALQSPARIGQPRVKRNGQWQDVDWQTALNFVAEGLLKVNNTHGRNKIAGFCSPSSTVEEAYLMQKVLRGIGVQSLDYRLKQTDLRDDERSVAPISEAAFANLDKAKNLLIFGANLREELPLAAIRVRKAVLDGAKLGLISPIAYELNTDFAAKDIVPVSKMVERLHMLVSLLLSEVELEPEHQKVFKPLDADPSISSLFESLGQGTEPITLISGLLSNQHPESSRLRSLLSLIKHYLPKIEILQITEGPNSAGCYLAGMLPTKGPAQRQEENSGLGADAALRQKMNGYVLLGVEPEFDFANPTLARQSLLAADFVVSLSAFVSSATLDCADVILPIAAFSETSGTYVNANGLWQSFAGCVAPFGSARPAWKVLRVLGNLLDVADIEYESSEQVRNDLENLIACTPKEARAFYLPQDGYQVTTETTAGHLERIGQWPLYRMDSLSRYAEPLQASGANAASVARVHPETLKHVNVAKTVTVSQGEIEITLPIELDASIAEGSISIASGLAETIDLSEPFAEIFVK